jgi:membrane protein required for beta-lactamase induction
METVLNLLIFSAVTVAVPAVLLSPLFLDLRQWMQRVGQQSVESFAKQVEHIEGKAKKVSVEQYSHEVWLGKGWRRWLRYPYWLISCGPCGGAWGAILARCLLGLSVVPDSFLTWQDVTVHVLLGLSISKLVFRRVF